MAAVTVAEGPHINVTGSKRRVSVKLTAPADGDTWVTGLANIDNVQITPVGATLAATDAFGVNSVSGGTVTFEVVGVARDLYVEALGN